MWTKTKILVLQAQQQHCKFTTFLLCNITQSKWVRFPSILMYLDSKFGTLSSILHQLRKSLLNL